MAGKKHLFLVMSPTAPPVVDHVKRSIIDDIKSKSFFSVFNIVAVVAILVIGYFLYKKFNDKFKKGEIKLPSMDPVSMVQTAQAAPVQVIEEEEEEVEESKED